MTRPKEQGGSGLDMGMEPPTAGGYNMPQSILPLYIVSSRAKTQVTKLGGKSLN